MDEKLYFEIDDMSIDNETGETDSAGLAIGGIDPEIIAQMTPEMKVTVACRVTGLARERIHPISKETYTELYGD